jgi:hypothetical protein
VPQRLSHLTRCNGPSPPERASKVVPEAALVERDPPQPPPSNVVAWHYCGQAVSGDHIGTPVGEGYGELNWRG